MTISMGKEPFKNYVTPGVCVGMVIFDTGCYKNVRGCGGHSSFVMQQIFHPMYLFI